MALNSRAQPHRNNNTSLYAFGGSSSSAHHHQADPCDASCHYLKLHGQAGDHVMQGRGGKVLTDSNDGSLLSFEDIYEAGAGGHAVGYENYSSTYHAECFGNSLHSASSLDNHILTGDSRSHLKGKVSSNKDGTLDWFYLSDAADDQTGVHKRPIMDESCTPPNKKQCTSTATAKKSKAKQPVASKDPQSMAAKNRRERISERLKTLQELVPNGTKVDLVTMLEKAIVYVNFLQLQVKVLAADEFWPVQGGKAPELSQVKDAIDAILSSQRSDRNSTSD